MTAIPIAGKPGCGPHVCEADDSATRIAWQPATRSEERCRVLRRTCECQPTVYHLITAGGRGYVERTCRGQPTKQTVRMSYSDVAALWERILLGQAV
ncbi:hypothetical protein Sme01_65110 [Sphaerisporangium melleum]|uniref:Uncharacterized protein n=1 Tax=Sphaerisporangium melleum TaxID=321316 RepID=A0A917VQC6_9ACTN|nr:hypothetical protein [Sphaerisporangium melleum]GGL03646.1 hypothetical protein GCM10007964_52190 [Sphaerisporangium melleum]GII74035.1 hypothetical protein Sme01_65110 [Sphaerisporangium melleum]